MQKSSIPAKYLLPWAQNDTSKVEVPVTTTDPTRASLSLGFPPLTEQPPEVGGVPPQGEDFNGGMNQISRAIWWMMQGGGFPYDSAFASASQIGGYINSAAIPRADGAGFWLSTADNNLTNPDATDGTAANWVPLNVYGTGTINVTATTVTVYPVTAAFPVLLISGTLTANTVVNLPAWTYQWKIVDNTVRAGFTLTVQTALGSGVVIQTGSQDVRGDGTNIVQKPQSIAAPTQPTHAVQLAQLQTDSLNYGVAGGTADALTVTLPAGVTALTDGFPVTVKLAYANATTTPTLAITIGTTAISALTIVKGANAALAAGDLPGAGAEANFVYSQSLGKLVLMNPATGVNGLLVPIDNTGAAADISLAIGQYAYIDITAATSVPLHVATADNQVYEIQMLLEGGASGTGSSGNVFLSPNNTTYTNFFHVLALNGNASAIVTVATYYNSFLIGYSVDPRRIICSVSTKTESKSVTFSAYGMASSTVDEFNTGTSTWNATASNSTVPDTTILYTSLGTVTLPLAATGRIIVKRTA